MPFFQTTPSYTITASPFSKALRNFSMRPAMEAMKGKIPSIRDIPVVRLLWSKLYRMRNGSPCTWMQSQVLYYGFKQRRRKQGIHSSLWLWVCGYQEKKGRMKSCGSWYTVWEYRHANLGFQDSGGADASNWRLSSRVFFKDSQSRVNYRDQIEEHHRRILGSFRR